MTHSFKINDDYLLFDIESSNLMSIDKIVFDVLNNADLRCYSQEEIDEVDKELARLRADGLIDTTAPSLPDSPKSKEIKSMCLHLSHDCNLRCKYCFADEGAYHGKRENMPFEVCRNAIDFLISNSGKRRNLEVDFFGGEPLINFDVLKQTVEYAESEAKKYNKFFKFTTTTNGVLLSKEVSDYLNEKMDNVVLSLDGRKEVNDAH
ncbi:MAG: 4Fe-4S cluster-binding domain-containing protein, partial [Clostridia bacterium]